MRYAFGLVGDQEYDAISERMFPALMREVNAADLAFVVHVGDFRSGSSPPCSDALYRQRYAELDASVHPLVYTPGENDWADCDKDGSGRDPLERLARLREVFFGGDESLGRRRIRLARQSEDACYAAYRENVYWKHGAVCFATLHVGGANDNWGRTAETDAEHAARDAANRAWLEHVFERARREEARAVALFTHGNPRFEAWLPARRAKILGVNVPPSESSGYRALVAALETVVVAFGKPVMLLHGDTHYFRVDKPLFRSGVTGPDEFGSQIHNFTRVEVFGFPEAHWVRVIVDEDDPNVFSVRQEIVAENGARPHDR